MDNKFIEVKMSDAGAMYLTRKFTTWYYDTNQDEDEFEVMANIVLWSRVPVSLSYLNLSEVFQEILDCLPQSERATYASEFLCARAA